MEAKDRILVALDTDHVGGFKIGLEALLGIGLKDALNAMRGYGQATDNVFVDVKTHDIPETIRKAVRTVVKHPQVKFVNVHASAGAAGLRAAVEAKGNAKVLAVTVLTSFSEDACRDVYGAGVQMTVGKFVSAALEAGVDGIICSPQEAEWLSIQPSLQRLLYVTPGVRPKWSAKNDQERVTTPAQAVRNGSTHLVIGRPILEAKDYGRTPIGAAHAIADEIAQALR
jgi:orotidine-5'-phosphate decarboxylase